MIRNLVLLSAVLFSASTFHIPIHPPVDTLTVESLLGKYRGFNYTTTSGAPAEIFLGIRYAQPPLGELRFEVNISEITKIKNSETREDWAPPWCVQRHQIL